MRFGVILYITVFPVFLVGCSSSPPPLHQVTGTVTINGKPARAVKVYFYPADGAEDNWTTRHSLAETDADGRFQLAKGIEAGEYKVLFSQFVDQRGIPVGSGEDKPDEFGAVHDRIPHPYSDHSNYLNSPETRTVSAEETDFTFSLSFPLES